MSNEVNARLAQLEAQGAGSSDGWNGVDNINPVGTKPKSGSDAIEFKQASDMLNGTYTDRAGNIHHVDADGNPIDVQAPVEDSREKLGKYSGIASVQDSTTLESKHTAAYESGDSTAIQSSISDQLISRFHTQMDAYGSNPKAVWQDVQTYAKTNLDNATRKEFNRTMSNGTGPEKQQAVTNLINSFANHNNI